jgi:FtsH-binding integral membrane protein
MFVHIFDTLFTSKGQSLTSTPIFRNWIIIVVLFFVVFLLMMFFQKSFYLQHVFFILWVVLVGCILFMLFSKNRGLFYQAVGSAFAILLVFTIVAMKNPNLISPSVAVYLIMALVALIMARIIEIFLGIFNVIDTEQMRTSSRALSYIAILLFTLFIVYDTGVIQRDALRCNSTTNPPNYISSSTGIFLDTLNLATNIFNIQD